MIYAVHDLVGTDTVGVIHELQERLPAVAAHLPELAAVPPLRLPAGQDALRAVGALKQCCIGSKCNYAYSLTKVFKAIHLK